MVGNGTIATQIEAADTIESFDTIVRFNNFQTQGYEKYVGSRTDIWVTRLCSTIYPRTQDEKENFKEVIGVINWCKWTQGIVMRIPGFLEEYPDAKLIRAEQVKKYVEPFGYSKMRNWLSVGMITILYFLENRCDKLYLYGFGGDVSNHYFKLKPSGEHHHNWKKEAEKLDQLKQEGKIEII